MNFKVGYKIKLLSIDNLPNKRTDMHFAYDNGREIYLAPEMIQYLHNTYIFKIKEDGFGDWSFLFDWIEDKPKTPRGNRRC